VQAEEEDCRPLWMMPIARMKINEKKKMKAV
jgi:hypothetical protein